MRLTVATHDAVKFACLKFHYAKAVPSVAIAFNVYNDREEWCGCIVYGYGSNNHIGCEYNLVQGEVFELVRVALNGKQEQTSKAVAMSLKELKKRYPLLKLIVSYADCDQSHLGTIYQATNWVYVGSVYVNQNDGGFIIKGKKVHGRTIDSQIKRMGGLKEGQTRLDFVHKYHDKNAIPHITKGKRKYLFPLTKAMKKKCEALRKPYPKEAGWTKIDRTSFKKEKK